MLLAPRSALSALTFSLALLLANSAFSADTAATVENGKEVGFFYKLTVDGQVVDTNEGQKPMVYVQGAGQILPALEAELAGMKVDEKKTVKLDAANAYGEVDPARMQEVPTERIPEGARQAGAVLQAEGYPGPIRVVEVKDKVTIVDFNHPLAGKALTFDITIASIGVPAPLPANPAASAPAADKPAAQPSAEPEAKSAN